MRSVIEVEQESSTSCRTSELEDASYSSRKLALLRIDSFAVIAAAVDQRGNSVSSTKSTSTRNGNNNDVSYCQSNTSCGGGGIANELATILRVALLGARTNNNSNNNINNNDVLSLSPLLRILKILENVTINDVTLSEEVDTSKGFRECLHQISHIQLHQHQHQHQHQQIRTDNDDADVKNNDNHTGYSGCCDDDKDYRILLKTIKELAVTIANFLSRLETRTDKVDPFTNSQLQSRLPLVLFGRGRPIRRNKYQTKSNHEQQKHKKQWTNNNLEIMIHQVTSKKETESHDTGYVLWPSSMILARLISDSDNSSLIVSTCSRNNNNNKDTNNDGDSNNDVLELGAGCGLVGLTAIALLRQHNEDIYRMKCDCDCDDYYDESREQEYNVPNNNNDNEISSYSYCNATIIFTDYLVPVLENIERNICLNDFNDNKNDINEKKAKVTTKVAGLDFFDQPGNQDSKYEFSTSTTLHNYWIDMTGTKQPQVRLVLAADVLAYSNDAVNVANTIFAALIEGGKAIIVSADEKKRYGVMEFPNACNDAGLKITSISRCKQLQLDDNDNDNENENANDDSFSTTNNCSSPSGDDGVQEIFVHSMEDTVGYDNNGQETSEYNLVIFRIEKPMA